MQKEILLSILEQNQLTNSFAFNEVKTENISYKLSKEANSAGFIYRHIGETMLMFGTFFGIVTEVENTTMGQTDSGQGSDVEKSKDLINRGYTMLRELIESKSESDWLETIETPFFGEVTQIRLFSHILFHNSNHFGQISLILAKGRKY